MTAEWSPTSWPATRRAWSSAAGAPVPRQNCHVGLSKARPPPYGPALAGAPPPRLQLPWAFRPPCQAMPCHAHEGRGSPALGVLSTVRTPARTHARNSLRIASFSKYTHLTRQRHFRSYLTHTAQSEHTRTLRPVSHSPTLPPTPNPLPQDYSIGRGRTRVIMASKVAQKRVSLGWRR